VKIPFVGYFDIMRRYLPTRLGVRHYKEAIFSVKGCAMTLKSKALVNTFYIKIKSLLIFVVKTFALSQLVFSSQFVNVSAKDIKKKKKLQTSKYLLIAAQSMSFHMTYA